MVDNAEIYGLIRECKKMLIEAQESVAKSFYTPPHASDDQRLEIAASIDWAIKSDPVINSIKNHIAWLYSIRIPEPIMIKCNEDGSIGKILTWKDVYIDPRQDLECVPQAVPQCENKKALENDLHSQEPGFIDGTEERT